MKKKLFIKAVVLIIFIISIAKIIIDIQYDNMLNDTFGKKAKQLEILKRKEGLSFKKFTLSNKKEITAFIGKLNIDKWKPRYLDLNCYEFRYRVIINKTKIAYFSVSANNTCICSIDGKFYNVPRNVYSYLADYK